METENTSLIERVNEWIIQSISIKLLSIGVLILILLIPSSEISSLIEERQLRAGEVTEEVAAKWSGHQTFGGPVIMIPYTRTEKSDWGKEGIRITEVRENAFFLPDLLKIDGKVTPQVLHRGIFDAAVYESDLDVQASFSLPNFALLGIDESKILWREAKVIFGLADLRGIKEDPQLISNGITLKSEPTTNLEVRFNKNLSDPAMIAQSASGIVANLNWDKAGDFQKDIGLKLSLKGNSYLYFLPLGKITEVSLGGPWSNPSFDGEFLPASRSVTEDSFSANWKILHFNRPFPQQWVGRDKSFAGYEFGVKLIIPVDQYQKTTRTAKYGILLIVLSFVSLLMVELVNKIRIHPFQYILVGAALILYYSLLLSISEHLGFNIAYMIATVSTVSMLALYAKSFIGDAKITALFSFLLILFYTFIFVIIQVQDFSLLLGSIGLFIVLAALMHMSRKVRWYGNSKV